MSIPEADSRLHDVLRLIEPSAAHKRSAARSHAYAKQVLANTTFGDWIVGARLIGSYARHTAIAPIDDIDVLLEIDPNGWSNAWLSGLPDPKKIIADLRRAAKTGYPSSRVQQQRRSVGVCMTKQSIDLVPAIRQSNEVFWIPDRSDGDWVKTAPMMHTSRVSELNAANNKLFVPMVKLLKRWNGELPQTAILKSIAIESIAGRVFAHHHPRSLSEGLWWFFDFVVHASGAFGPSTHFRWPGTYGVSFGVLGASVPGLSVVDDNIVDGLPRERSRRFVEKARVARDRFKRAEERPTPSSVAKEMGDLMKVDF